MIKERTVRTALIYILAIGMLALGIVIIMTGYLENSRIQATFTHVGYAFPVSEIANTRTIKFSKDGTCKISQGDVQYSGAYKYDARTGKVVCTVEYGHDNYSHPVAVGYGTIDKKGNLTFDEKSDGTFKPLCRTHEDCVFHIA